MPVTFHIYIWAFLIYSAIIYLRPGDLLNLYFQFLADGLEHIRYSVNVDFVIQIKDLLLLGDLSLFYVYFLD